eukprot:SAG25_NODE_5167_length_694_cov_0.776471_1_plen_212_part_10
MLASPRTPGHGGDGFTSSPDEADTVLFVLHCSVQDKEWTLTRRFAELSDLRNHLVSTNSAALQFDAAFPSARWRNAKLDARALEVWGHKITAWLGQVVRHCATDPFLYHYACSPAVASAAPAGNTDEEVSADMDVAIAPLASCVEVGPTEANAAPAGNGVGAQSASSRPSVLPAFAGDKRAGATASSWLTSAASTLEPGTVKPPLVTPALA